MSSSNPSQHKRLAMGQKVTGMKSGGSVSILPAKPSNLKTGIKDNPIENVRRANGIKGMKKGGGC